MSIEIRVPVLPESVTEATVLDWHKKVGETVRRDENLVDIETEKVVLEVPAVEDGVLREIRATAGTTVAAREVIAILEPSASAATVPAVTAQPAVVAAAATPAPAQPAAAAAGPAAQRMAAEHGVDLGKVPATGKGGRATKEDVITYLKRHINEDPATTRAPSPGAPAPALPAAPAVAAAPPGERRDRRERMSRLRQTIATRLVQVQHTAAILTTFNEVNLHAVMELRRKYRETFEQRHGVRLGVMSFFVRACVEALRRHPVVNASVEGDEIVYHDYCDIGIAVAGPRGLVVPVLRNAQQMGFAEIEKAIGAFGERARGGSLTVEELSGGTFTITNGGVFGSLMSTPILNPPQSAILGMHAIKDRPVVENGEVRVRPMMYLAVSYDHRIIDGRDAVQFLVAIRDLLEDPARLLLEI